MCNVRNYIDIVVCIYNPTLFKLHSTFPVALGRVNTVARSKWSPGRLLAVRCLIFISYNQIFFLYFSSSLPSCSLHPWPSGLYSRRSIFSSASDSKFNHTCDGNVQPYKRISNFPLCLAFFLSSSNSHAHWQQWLSSGFFLILSFALALSPFSRPPLTHTVHTNTQLKQLNKPDRMC